MGKNRKKTGKSGEKPTREGEIRAFLLTKSQLFDILLWNK
jgi:hypothetical protein